MPIDTKEITPIKAQSTKAYKYANNLEIVNEKEEKKAIEELSAINKIGDNIAEKKEAILGPLLASTKEIRELFKPTEENVKNAIAIIKQKLIAYRTKVEASHKKEEQKIISKVNSGNIKIETAVKKMDQLGTLAVGVKTESGSISYKTVRKARIVDVNKVPKEYFILDEAKAKKAALLIGGLGELIPGVEVYEEKEIANKR